MIGKKVHVVVRINEGKWTVVDGVYTTEAKAKKRIDELLTDFGVSRKDYDYGNTEYFWEIHSEKVE